MTLDQPMPTAMEIVCPAIAPVIAPTGVASIIRTRSQIKKPVKGADSSSESNTVQSVGSNQTIETQNQTQIRIRSNALADDLTADQEASQAVSPGKSARSKSQPKEPAQPQSEAPSAGSTPNLLAPPGKQAAVASLISSSKSLPHTGSQEPYSAIDSLASPRSIEEFNLNRLQAIKLNNKRVYSNGNAPIWSLCCLTLFGLEHQCKAIPAVNTRVANRLNSFIRSRQRPGQVHRAHRSASDPVQCEDR